MDTTFNPLMVSIRLRSGYVANSFSTLQGLGCPSQKEVLLQRLFSTFADGWPGIGLLFQRFLTALVLVHYAIRFLGEAPQSLLIVTHMIGAIAGAFLFVGFWTPLAGTVVAIAEIWIVFSQPGDPWIHVILAILGATLAMIGPGAWSIDARLFGRKHIQTPGH